MLPGGYELRNGLELDYVEQHAEVAVCVDDVKFVSLSTLRNMRSVARVAKAAAQ